VAVEADGERQACQVARPIRQNRKRLAQPQPLEVLVNRHPDEPNENTRDMPQGAAGHVRDVLKPKRTGVASVQKFDDCHDTLERLVPPVGTDGDHLTTLMRPERSPQNLQRRVLNDKRLDSASRVQVSHELALQQMDFGTGDGRSRGPIFGHVLQNVVEETGLKPNRRTLIPDAERMLDLERLTGSKEHDRIRIADQ